MMDIKLNIHYIIHLDIIIMDKITKIIDIMLSMEHTQIQIMALGILLVMRKKIKKIKKKNQIQMKILRKLLFMKNIKKKQNINEK